MKKSFYGSRTQKEKILYKDLLEVTGALSKLFSESSNPFLYYRSMENIFCKAFKAENLSRSDISADAKKGKIGIGLKTFLQNNSSTFQKVAEFNKESYLFRGLNEKEIVIQVSKMRNERIKTTMRICELNDMIYHLITRSENYMSIFEEHMDLIDISNIRNIKKIKNSIHFDDGKNQYNFSLSKNTLFKRFETPLNKQIYGFNVKVLEDPFSILLNIKNNKKIQINDLSDKENEKEDYIILPLYSQRTGEVEAKSGLNQWNAGGRKRNKNEVYIPVPSWIHKEKVGFFEYNTNDHKTEPFLVKLPNGKKISMKLAQQGGKALMSNPNRELGKWILRDILQLKEGQLVTKKKLDIIGIDSVKLTKIGDNEFYLDFLKSGSYEEFKRINTKEKK